MTPHAKKRARAIGLLLLTIVTTVAAIVWVDHPLAHAISRGAKPGGPVQIATQIAVPDLLTWFVVVATLASWLGYLVLWLARANSRLICALQVTGTALPFAYAAKTLAKSSFGRINTRFWLLNPQQSGFQWFSVDASHMGFPSGHMTVFAALAFTVMHDYPRLRIPGSIALLVIASALVITEYHFLSDVIAGTYVGYLSHCAARALPGTVPAHHRL